MPHRTLGMRRPQTVPPLLALLTTLAGGCDEADSADAVQSPAGQDARLAAALLAEFPYYRDCPTPDDRGALRYLAGRVDLDGDGRPEVVALASGRDACGSGGCMAFVLRDHGEGYRLVSAISTVRAPILGATERSRGWRDLIVEVGGGGAEGGARRLRFDGKGYPDNASLEPAAGAKGKGAETIIANDDIETIAAAPLLVPAACAALPAAAESSPITSEALGGLRIGSAAAEVERQLGSPVQPGEPQLWGADGLYHRDWRFPSHGVVVGLSGETSSGPWQVDCLTLSPPATLTTTRGIGIGATEARVRTAYPDAAAARADGSGRALSVGSDYDALIFSFGKRGRVNRVFLGAPAE